MHQKRNVTQIVQIFLSIFIEKMGDLFMPRMSEAFIIYPHTHSMHSSTTPVITPVLFCDVLKKELYQVTSEIHISSFMIMSMYLNTESVNANSIPCICHHKNQMQSWNLRTTQDSEHKSLPVSKILTNEHLITWFHRTVYRIPWCVLWDMQLFLPSYERPPRRNTCDPSDKHLHGSSLCLDRDTWRKCSTSFISTCFDFKQATQTVIRHLHGKNKQRSSFSDQDWKPVNYKLSWGALSYPNSQSNIANYNEAFV